MSEDAEFRKHKNGNLFAIRHEKISVKDGKLTVYYEACGDMKAAEQYVSNKVNKVISDLHDKMEYN